MSSEALLAGGLSLATAMAISTALTPLVRRWARRTGFVDHPDGPEGHKTHRLPTAFGGGIAITAAILLPMAGGMLLAVLANHNGGRFLARAMPNWPYWMGGVMAKVPTGLAIIGGGLVMHIMGLIDDRRPLPAVPKLIIQLVVALILTAGFGIRAGEALGTVPAVLLTTLWIVGLTNAFNFMDNMDGLAAGVAALTAIVLAGAAFVAGQVFVPCVLLLVAGAVLGFLIYNFPPATIFMGDAGSLVVGYFLAVATVLVTFYNPEQQHTPFGIFMPLVVFAVPIYDITSVTINRHRRGVSIFQSDRHHFSHRLVRLGLSRTAAVLTIYLATAATALPAVLLPRLNWAGAGLIFGQCLCVVAVIAILESRDGP